MFNEIVTENVLVEFINQYGVTLLYTAITAIAGYVGIVIKNLYKNYVNDKTAEKVVKTCVKAVQQLYSDLEADEKLNKCLANAEEMLASKGITITDLELRMLIEAAVLEVKNTVTAK